MLYHAFVVTYVTARYKLSYYYYYFMPYSFMGEKKGNVKWSDGEFVEITLH